VGLKAQVRVESEISSLEMLVGEQVALTVTVHAPDTASVVFPNHLLLPNDIEVLQAVQEPAVPEREGMSIYRCYYVLTCFRDTLYPIPPIEVTVSGQQLSTRQLALKVLTVDVDTTNFEKYYGPHDVQSLPMSWSQYNWDTSYWLSIVVLFLIIVCIYLIVRLKSNKPIVARIRIIKRILPHQRAMKAIDQIKAEHIGAMDDAKEYYTRLTDTLRQYINERYGFNAMEMTSSEIIERLTKTDDPTSLEELRQLFTTADLVKFAKYSTLMNENDANLVSAVDFINKTKIENMPTEEVVKPQLTDEQMQSKVRRKGLIAAITVLCVAIVALLVWIGWIVYDVMLY
jgi:hypothetical protein